MYNEILDKMQESLKDEIENFAGNFGQTEIAVMNLMLSFGKGLLQRLVDQHPNGYQGSSIACKCGDSMKFIQHRPRDIHTLFGWITVKRAYYHCVDCGSGFAPYDKTGGLGLEQLSPALAKACCTLAVDDSFEYTARKIEALFGQKVSDNTIERVVHQTGSVAIGQQDEQLKSFFNKRQMPQARVNPQRLYVCPDGTTVHERDGWHETKVGCIYWENDLLQRQQQYIGRFDNSDVFGTYLWLQACRCGFREAGEVIYIGDGAAWIRTIHDQRFSKSVFIVDWYHASEHIWDCGKVLFGDGTDETKRWVERRLNLLWDGWTRKLLMLLDKERPSYRGSRRQAMDRLYHYITVNEQQMRYDVFRSKGYDIGSGAVEGACKYVVGKRLKQSGMVWTRDGSSATLALRICWLNKEWDNLWSKKPLAA